MFSYHLYRLGNWITFFAALAVFILILQGVAWIRRDVLGVRTPAVAPQAGQQQTAVPPTASTPSPSPTSTHPSPVIQNPAPVVPAGPSPAVIREQLQEARDRLVESSVQVDQALKSISDWDSEIPPLLQTSAGDKIAAHEDLVASLTEIVNEERPPKSKIQDHAKRIATLRTELGKRATSSTPKPLTDKEIEEIDELQTAVSAADEAWDNALHSARAIKILAEARGEPEKKRTLKEEIEVKAAEDMLAQRQKRQQEEEARKAREAEEKLRQEELAAERRREQERLEAERQQAAEEAAREQQRKEAELLARARSPEVQSALAPFLHPRGVQPRKSGSFSVQFRSTFEESPMSFSALKGMGALEPSTLGLQWLALIGGNRKLPEGPRWGVPSQPNSWSEDDKKMLKEAQELLRELGPILVKDGQLSP